MHIRNVLAFYMYMYVDDVIEFTLCVYILQVIVALSEKNRSHIPYRNSMMTLMLRDRYGTARYKMQRTPSVHVKEYPKLGTILRVYRIGMLYMHIEKCTN